MGPDPTVDPRVPSVVRFDVRGKDFTTTLEAIDRYPDSYLAWLVRNAPEQVRSGRPISINRKPESFRSLLENYRKANSHSDITIRPAISHRQLPRARNECSLVPFDQHPMPQSLARLPQPPPPPPPPRPPPPPGPPPGPPASQIANVKCQSSWYSEPQTLALPSVTSARKRYGQAQREVVKLGQGCHVAPAQRGTNEVVDEAVKDTIALLQRYSHKIQMYDKALFVLIWGRKDEGGRILRPQLSKLYDSMTGRVHDVRRSSESSGSFERQGGWGEFDSVYSATCLSARVQQMVVEKLRKAGHGCSFAEVRLDKAGRVDWRGSRRDPQSHNSLDSSTIRCLVVNLR